MTISGETAGVSPRHCSIQFHGDQIVLQDTSEEGTFVDDQRVNGSITLKLGQLIRIGTPAEQLELIACLE